MLWVLIIKGSYTSSCSGLDFEAQNQQMWTGSSFSSSLLHVWCWSESLTTMGLEATVMLLCFPEENSGISPVKTKRLQSNFLASRRRREARQRRLRPSETSPPRCVLSLGVNAYEETPLYCPLSAPRCLRFCSAQRFIFETTSKQWAQFPAWGEESSKHD